MIYFDDYQMTAISSSDPWFTTQVDRCFETGIYGMGIRLYRKSGWGGYVHIKGVSYCPDKNELTVETVTEKPERFILQSEPDTKNFKATLGKKWKSWDAACGESMEEDRPDYCPWAHDSLSSLAAELKVHDGSPKYCKP